MKIRIDFGNERVFKQPSREFEIWIANNLTYNVFMMIDWRTNYHVCSYMSILEFSVWFINIWEIETLDRKLTGSE